MNFHNLSIAPLFPLWVIVLLLSLGLTAAIIQYWLLQKRLGRTRALSLSLLRLGALSLLISFSLNPSLVEKKEHKGISTLSFLVETSRSMDLPGRSGKGSRLDEAKGLLSSSLLKSLTETYEVKLHTLGESLKAVEAGELNSLKATGKSGDLSDALSKLEGKSSLAILLSDGNLKWSETPGKGHPLLIVPLGEPVEYQDILIKAVKAPTLAFRGREVSVDVTIKSYGYRGLTIPVLLKDGTRLLKAKSIQLGESSTEVTVPLSFTPEEVGDYNLSVSVPPQFGESLPANNLVNFSLKVVRDKIRILMISGSPSLSYRFMRTAFKNDPSIDLLSFVILRTPSDIINVPLQEQSLIPFPVETLFSKELKNFDLLIFDNFPSHLYLSPNYLGTVQEFIREGGGLAMIGGPNLLDEGRYAGTPMGEILPVRVTGKEEYRRASPSEVKPGRAGLTHPITRLLPKESDNLTLWREMPLLDGINFLEPKGSGIVLLENSASRPILTVGNYGKGRVLVLTTDYSWKWYMGMIARGKGNWAYLRFMERMVRWLTRDPSVNPAQIHLPEEARQIGQEMEVRISVEENPSNPKGAVSFSVLNPESVKIESSLRPGGKPGEYIGSFLPDKEGTYKLKVETLVGNLEESLIIAVPGEDLDGAPDFERLKWIAASTGGKLLSKGDDLLKEIAALAEKKQNRFLEEKLLPLWGMPYSLLIILALLAPEWYFRRRWGLI